jgi:hypothetical protein
MGTHSAGSCGENMKHEGTFLYASILFINGSKFAWNQGKLYLELEQTDESCIFYRKGAF